MFANGRRAPGRCCGNPSAFLREDGRDEEGACALHAVDVHYCAKTQILFDLTLWV